MRIRLQGSVGYCREGGEQAVAELDLVFGRKCAMSEDPLMELARLAHAAAPVRECEVVGPAARPGVRGSGTRRRQRTNTSSAPTAGYIPTAVAGTVRGEASDQLLALRPATTSEQRTQRHQSGDGLANRRLDADIKRG
jgi:hypothetical protein